MKRNKSGFIAISLIYSFFLVLLMMLLAILVDYTHNRVLLSKVKKATQEKLNGISSFNPIGIKAKTNGSRYFPGEEVFYANRYWYVMEDDDTYITIFLRDALEEEEIKGILPVEYHSIANGVKMQLCLDTQESLNCYNYGENNLSYTWENSLAKLVTNSWLENDFLLQKAIALGTLSLMSFTDGNINADGSEKTYEEYVRIPTKNEIVRDNTCEYIWTLSVGEENSVFRIKNCNSFTSIEELIETPVTNRIAGIHPIIKVKKI